MAIGFYLGDPELGVVTGKRLSMSRGVDGVLSQRQALERMGWKPK